MGFFERFRREPAAERAEPDAEERSANMSMQQFAEFVVGGNSYSMSVENATACVAVLACIRVRAETLAAMPCHLYRERDDGGSDRMRDGVAALMEDGPNDYMTPYEFWAWKQQEEDIRGNAYALKVRRGGRVSALWPLETSAMAVRQAGGGIYYQYSGDEHVPAQDFHADDIVHFRGTVLANRFEGESLVRLTRDTLKIGREAEAFFDRLIENGTHFPRYFETDRDVDRRSIEDLREQLDGISGVFEAGKTRVFGPGLHLKQSPLTLHDVDFSAQLRWNLEQVSRIWRVPLPILNDLTHGTYTNSEQASLWLAQYTMAPVCAATEQRLKKAVLMPGEYAKFNMAQLQRGDYRTRTEGYARMVSAGIMTRNEARRLEEMNPIEGLDRPLISLATGTVDADGSTVNPNIVDPVAKDARDRIRARLERDGDTERSRKYMRMVAEPVVRSLNLAGADTDVDAFVEEAINGTGD